MTRSPRVRSGDIEHDGNGAVAFFSSGAIQAAAATVRTGFVSPVHGKVVSFDVVIVTAYNNTGSTLNMGTWGDAQNDDLLNDYDVEDVVAGSYNLIGSALWVSKTVSKGALYGIGGTFANTTGLGYITVGIGPVQSPA